jgi:hypothetical protein
VTQNTELIWFWPLQSASTVHTIEGESTSGTEALPSLMPDTTERAQTPVIVVPQSTVDTQAPRFLSIVLPDACRLSTPSRVMDAGLLPELFALARSAEPQALRLRTRLQDGIRKEKKFTDGTIRYGCSATTDEPREPKDQTAAFEDKNWKMAMDDEIQTLDRNKTWHLVSPSKIMNIIDCKWVYKVKRKADGSLDRYKARLVAKGFKQ